MTLWPGNEKFAKDYHVQMHEIINEDRCANVEAQCREGSKTQEDYLGCLTRSDIAELQLLSLSFDDGVFFDC
ncbi:hypothetical protein L596_025534 [Steinernema carpocapsae]|uniref:Uncharacterized protein n=1 Tax=Steinernema carpocapsae TaxID=34508 RepID=A0A4U5M8V2_STECR|nr:hypothetical protein L596_025534 [Steinernema carpocapsae]